MGKINLDTRKSIQSYQFDKCEKCDKHFLIELREGKKIEVYHICPDCLNQPDKLIKNTIIEINAPDSLVQEAFRSYTF